MKREVIERAFCKTTGLECSGCNPCCEHRELKEVELKSESASSKRKEVLSRVIREQVIICPQCNGTGLMEDEYFCTTECDYCGGLRVVRELEVHEKV